MVLSVTEGGVRTYDLVLRSLVGGSRVRNATMLTIVANPIGKVPRKRDCCGWKSILRKTEGHSVYRRLEVYSSAEAIER